MNERINLLLTVSDIIKSVDFYENRLGMKKNTELKDGEDIRYMDFTCGPNVLMLVPQEYKEPNSGGIKGLGIEIYIDPGTEIKVLYEELKGRGMVFSKDLYITPWNTYQFHLEDPDGYKLIYSQEIPVIK